MPIEKAKDNQWWYTDSMLKEQVEHASHATLIIKDRHCQMVHSRPGTDGRPTHSFTFLNDSDRLYWRALNGEEVEIQLIKADNVSPSIGVADGIRPAATPAEFAVPRDAPSLTDLQRRSNTLFDAYMFVDWSACSQPKRGRDSIWIAEGGYAADETFVTSFLSNPSGRDCARQRVLERLVELARSCKRVLVGFDFPYGYPSGWHTALGLQGHGCWRELWQLLRGSIEDAPDNSNNRWDIANQRNFQAAHNAGGPYWGRPATRIDLKNLPANKPPLIGAVANEFRQIERQLSQKGRQPKSVWQLYGNGSVGSQALLGIPVVEQLRQSPELVGCSLVWPFETGWQCGSPERGPFILHAEIWPGAIPVNPALHPVKDAAQMLGYVLWAATHDVRGTLAQRFNPSDAALQPGKEAQTVEGWILH